MTMDERIPDHCFRCPDDRMTHVSPISCHQALIERGLASSRRYGDDDPNSEETT
jgi:hypothetical protein